MSLRSEAVTVDNLAMELAVRKRLAAVVPSPRHHEASFETYQPKTASQAAALDAARRFAVHWMNPEVGALWLLGPVGTGKTHLAVSVLRDSIAADIESDYRGSYAFCDWHDVVDMFRQWPKRDERQTTLVQASLLVIDDLQIADEKTLSGFEWLVDRRYREQRTLILTSNLDPQSIREVVGHRSFDRLREGSILRVMQGVSHRARFGWDGPEVEA